MTAQRYALGLDVGTASIGVVAYWLDEKGTIIEGDNAIGFLESYVFKEPVDSSTSGLSTRMSARRSARLIRRQYDRKANRYRKLSHLLPLFGLSWSDIKTVRDAKGYDVFRLRKDALSQRIELAELICVLSHMQKNRGYKGNLKSEGGKVRKNIEALHKDAEERGVTYLGELWYAKKSDCDHTKEAWKNIAQDGTYIEREKVEAEFDSIWNTQAQYHSILHNSHVVQSDSHFLSYKKGEECTLYELVKDALFAQRPIWWDTGTIGMCPYASGKRRASEAQEAFQKYRIIKVLRDIRLQEREKLKANRFYKGEKLTQEQIESLYHYICTAIDEYNSEARIPFAKLYAHVGIDISTHRFSIDRDDEDKGIKGYETKHELHKAGLLSSFENESKAVQELCIECLACISDYNDILSHETIESLEDAIRSITGCRDKAIVQQTAHYIDSYIVPKIQESKDGKGLGIKLKSGRASYSTEVLDALAEALLNPAQYENAIRESTQEKQEDIDGIEYYILRALYPQQTVERTALRPLSSVITNNPMVDKTLYEVQKKLSYVMHYMGKQCGHYDERGRVKPLRPYRITIETSRDLNNSLAQREGIEKDQKEYAKDRANAYKDIVGHQGYPSEKNILRYRLWKEQKEDCAYCGQKLSFEEAMGTGTEVDHIIPQARGGNNRYSNKVLACSNCNNTKSDRTPQEALKDPNWGNEQAIERLASHLEEMAKKCRRKVGEKWKSTRKGKDVSHKAKMLRTDKSAEELTSGFSDRSGVATSWIAKILLDWLRDIAISDVVPSTGTLTAFLRKRLQLDCALAEIRIDENKPLFYSHKESGEMKRIEDVQKWKAIWGVKGKTETESLSSCERESNNRDDPQAILQEEYRQAQEKYKASKDEELGFDKFITYMRKSPEWTFHKRCDHRHHAIDAILIGLCDRGTIQRAATHRKKHYTLEEWIHKNTGEVHEEFKIDWLSEERLSQLREEIKRRLKGYVVWHKADYFPNDAFFEETAYGIRSKTGVWNKSKGEETRHMLYSRKSLRDILKVGAVGECKTKEAVIKALDGIVYPTVKKYLIDTICHGLDEGKTLKEIFEEGIRYEGNIVKKVKYEYMQVTPASLIHRARCDGSSVQWEQVDFENDGIDTKKDSYKVYYNNGYACMEFYPLAGRGEKKHAISIYEYQKQLVEYKKTHPKVKRLPRVEYDTTSEQYQKVFKQYQEEHGNNTCVELPLEMCEKHNDEIERLVDTYKKNSPKPKKKYIEELKSRLIPYTLRVFKGDMLWDKDSKEVYTVVGYKASKGIRRAISSEVYINNEELWYGDPSKFIVIKDRAHLAELLRERKQ